MEIPYNEKEPVGYDRLFIYISCESDGGTCALIS